MDDVDPGSDSPYKFLDYFNENDASNFSGRDGEISAILPRITKQRTFALYGRSGLGKTSLLLAGIFPRLRERGYQPIYIRTLESPVDDLCNAIAADLNEDPRLLPDGLSDLIKKRSDSRPIVLVLDQFEEFFIRFREEVSKRKDFVKLIVRLVSDNDLDIRVVFSFREDYLAELNDFRAALPRLVTNEYRLMPLTAFGARQAISNPLINAGIEYDQRLLGRMVDQLEPEGFDPALLQIICVAVYQEAVEHREGKPRLTIADLEEIGGFDGLFMGYLNTTIDAIPEELQLLAKNVLNELITGERTKRAIKLGSLLTAEFVADESDIKQTLQVLKTHKIIRVETRNDEHWYELLHDRLVAVIKEWLEFDTQYFAYRTAYDLVRNNAARELWRKNYDLLLNERQLAYVKPFGDLLKFSEIEREFLLLSSIYVQSEDAAYWAQGFPAEKNTSLLLTMLQGDDDDLRAGAAAAATRLEVLDGHVLQKITEMALGDSSLDARRTAGSALATHPGELVTDRLQAALGNRSERAAAMEVLADFIQQGESIGIYAFQQRRKARRIALKRELRKLSHTVRSRSSSGALTGLLSGFAWMLAIFPAFFMFMIWGLSSGAIEDYVVILFGAGFLVCGVLLSAVFGWHAVGLATKRTLAYPQNSLRRVVGGVWSISLVVGIIGGFIGLIFLESSDQLVDVIESVAESSGQAALYFTGFVLAVGLIFALAAQATVGIVVAFAKHWVNGASNTAHTALRAGIASVGIPVLVPGFAWVLSYEFLLNDEYGADEAFFLLFWLAAIVLALASAVVLMSVARVRRKYPVESDRQTSPLKVKVSGILSVMFAVGCVVWFEHYYGFEHNPLFSGSVVEYESCSDTPLEFEGPEFGRIFPSIRYISMTSRHGAVTLLRSLRARENSVDGQSFRTFAVIAPFAEAKLGFTAESSRFWESERVLIDLKCLGSDNIGFGDVKWVQLKRSDEPATWTTEIDLPQGVEIKLPRSQIGTAGRSVDAKLTTTGIDWGGYGNKFDRLSDRKLKFGRSSGLSRYGNIYAGESVAAFPVKLTLKFGPEAADALDQLNFIPLFYYTYPD